MCDYCEEDFDGYRSIIKNGGFINWTLFDKWYLEVNNRKINIFYCPMCGRELPEGG